MYTQNQLDSSQVLSWLIPKFAEWLEVSAEELDADQPISGYGLDSLSAVTLSVQLEEELGVELETALLWNYPTLRLLAEHLNEELSRRGVTEMPPA